MPWSNDQILLIFVADFICLQQFDFDLKDSWSNHVYLVSLFTLEIAEVIADVCSLNAFTFEFWNIFLEVIGYQLCLLFFILAFSENEIHI